MSFEVIVLGGGAAGLMCAISAGQRGLKVLVLERSNRIGKKILMSGGGRCNFTNLNTTPGDFLSSNPHFCKSALARYTPYDFLAMVDRHGIAWHEKSPGQLFCDHSAKQIVAMLATECSSVNAEIRTRCEIEAVARTGSGFEVHSNLGLFTAPKLVVATGGLSIPRMCATDFGYRLAEQFGLKVLPLSPALVPFTLPRQELEIWSELSGVSVDARVENQSGSMAFNEPVLFTHRGLSGPGILQISSYWQPGESIRTDLLPGRSATQWLEAGRRDHPGRSVLNHLTRLLGKRLGQTLSEQRLAGRVEVHKNLADINSDEMTHLASCLGGLEWHPAGTEGYRTAEVTLGGVDTDELSSRTFQTLRVPGLYLIGEVVDVTGHLGGYNFQWAWASGWCAGQNL